MLPRCVQIVGCLPCLSMAPYLAGSSRVRVLVWLCEWRWRLAGRSECRHTRRRQCDSERSLTELVWCGLVRACVAPIPRGGKSASRPRLRSRPIIGFGGITHFCLALLLLLLIQPSMSLLRVVRLQYHLISPAHLTRSFLTMAPSAVSKQSTLG
jgi:hypothetical protein